MYITGILNSAIRITEKIQKISQNVVYEFTIISWMRYENLNSLNNFFIQQLITIVL